MSVTEAPPSTTFEYSEAFRDLVVRFHAGKEQNPRYRGYVAAHLGGPGGRLDAFRRRLIPEIEHHCGTLAGKRVLDVGCGTGATSVALALSGAQVTAFDIDEPSMEICRRRVEEHGLSNRITPLRASSVREAAGSASDYDLVLLNAVVEHIPLSIQGLRAQVVGEAFDAVRPGGYLFISETPNRLCPKDIHTTGLWWIPWTRPGSRWAYARAVGRQLHEEECATHSTGPLGLEERGTWGATYFEILRYLAGRSYRVVNREAGHDRHLSYHEAPRRRRRIAESVVYNAISRWTGIPLAGLWPMITNLAIQKA